MKMVASASVPTANAQLRKIKKPLIERRRRERINDCLSQLKSLVLEAMNRDESCYSKMEKADILEMTVAHLKTIQQQPQPHLMSPVSTPSNEDAHKYLLGFNECAKEVGNYLSTVKELAVKVGAPLMKHLINCLESIQNFPSRNPVRNILSDACSRGTEEAKDYSALFPVSTPAGNVSDFSSPISSMSGPVPSVMLNLDVFSNSSKTLPSSGIQAHSLVPSDAKDGKTLPTVNMRLQNMGLDQSPVSCKSCSFSEDSGCVSPACSEQLQSSCPTTAIPFTFHIWHRSSQLSEFLSAIYPLSPELNNAIQDGGKQIKTELLPPGYPLMESSIWRPW